MDSTSTAFRDPATTLPLELFLQALQDLSKDDKLRARLVSRTWSECIQGASPLWKSLTWGMHPIQDRQMPLKGVDVLLKLASSADGVAHVRDLTLGGCHEEMKEVAKAIFSRVADLQILTLIRPHVRCSLLDFPDRLQRLVILCIYFDDGDMGRSQKSLATILDRIRSLEEVEFYNLMWDHSEDFRWPRGLVNLRELAMATLRCSGQNLPSVGCQHPFDHHRLASLASAAPNLDSLRLLYTCEPAPETPAELDFEGFKNLQSLTISQAMPALSPNKLPPRLRQLRWHSRGRFTEPDVLPAQYEEAPYLAELEHLQIMTCPAYDFWMNVFKKSRPSLRFLDIWSMEPRHPESATKHQRESNRPDWHEDLFFVLLRADYLTELRHLTLRGLRVDENRAAEIANSCPLLLSFSIIYTNGLSVAAARVLVAKPVPLEKLTVVAFNGSRRRDEAAELVRELRAAFPLLDISLDHCF